MIALDTNILVYARREESLQHVEARNLLKKLADGMDPWAIPWPCVYEFLRVVTHPRVFDPPTELEIALEDLDDLFASPSLVLIGEGPSHRAHFLSAVSAGKARGNLAHDAHIAALVLEHGIKELWTTDRDFSRFTGFRIRNPFDKPAGEKSAAYRTGTQKRAGRKVRRTSP